jgi:alkane 1-monooxygenase
MLKRLKNLKYLTGYSIPLLTWIAIYNPAKYAFLTLIYAFIVLPFLELFLPGSEKNPSSEEENSLNKKQSFDWMLWISVPVQWGTVVYFLIRFQTENFTLFQTIGMISAVGICCGVIGINIAHELGHRKNKFEQFLSKTLLLSSLYMHFIIEHNRGHHKYVATPLDPASAKLNQSVYTFVPLSIWKGYRSAWKIQLDLLTKQYKHFFSFQNEMLLFHFIQLILLGCILFVFGGKAVWAFIASALTGIILLEVINYIEHYGLKRKEISPGKYERVQPAHSWNSNHELGRIILFELTRHADHHYLSSRKYHTLRHFDNSPQLPSGYPAMMLLSLAPPLWFKIMNPKVEKFSS